MSSITVHLCSMYARWGPQVGNNAKKWLKGIISSMQILSIVPSEEFDSTDLSQNGWKISWVCERFSPL